MWKIIEVELKYEIHAMDYLCNIFTDNKKKIETQKIKDNTCITKQNSMVIARIE